MYIGFPESLKFFKRYLFDCSSELNFFLTSAVCSETTFKALFRDKEINVLIFDDETLLNSFLLKKESRCEQTTSKSNAFFGLTERVIELGF